MRSLPDGAWIDGEITTLPFVLLNQHMPQGGPLNRDDAFRVSNVLHAPLFTWCAEERPG